MLIADQEVLDYLDTSHGFYEVDFKLIILVSIRYIELTTSSG